MILGIFAFLFYYVLLFLCKKFIFKDKSIPISVIKYRYIISFVIGIILYISTVFILDSYVMQLSTDDIKTICMIFVMGSIFAFAPLIKSNGKLN